MMQRRRNMIRIGTWGTIGGLMILPMISSKIRKRISRSGRNAFFRISDYFQDMMDMRK